jgi:hypothetical protein
LGVEPGEHGVEGVVAAVLVGVSDAVGAAVAEGVLFERLEQ